MSRRFDEELGKAVCDRLGLAHESTMREWRSEGSGGTVFVFMTTMKSMPVDEYNELLAVAAERSKK